MGDGRVVPAFLTQAIRGGALPVFGDGSQTRSFCYVTDLVEGIIRLLNSDEHMPVNIGNPTEFTVMELAHIVSKMFGVELEIRNMPLPVDDPKVRRPDITRAREILGWEPKIPLEEGLESTAAYFRKVMSAQGE